MYGVEGRVGGWCVGAVRICWCGFRVSGYVGVGLGFRDMFVWVGRGVGGSGLIEVRGICQDM